MNATPKANGNSLVSVFTFADSPPPSSPHRPTSSPSCHSPSFRTPPRSTRSPSPIRETMLTRLACASSSSLESKEDTTVLQRVAMEKFLAAQLSGCPISKEETWKELVRVMKGPSRSRSSRGSNKSFSNDEVLGFIRIGCDNSIASGLTSPTSSPMSPYKRERSAGSFEEDTPSTVPSLPGCKEGNVMGPLPEFPSLPGCPSDGEEETFSLPLKKNYSITTSTEKEEDITHTNTPPSMNENESKKSSWDSLLVSSNDLENSLVSNLTDCSSSSVVKNVVYETSISKSIIKVNPTFFQENYPSNSSSSIDKEVVQIPQQSGLPPKVLTASPVITTQKEESSTYKSRKSRRESSLEEQVRNVVQLQHSQTVEESQITHSPSSPTPQLQKSDIVQRSKSESVASAQDILAELRRSPVPVRKVVLPKSISVRGPIATAETRRSPQLVSSGKRGIKSPSPLAPSRRDLPRPNRISRKSVSESGDEGAMTELFMSKTTHNLQDSYFVPKSTSSLPAISPAQSTATPTQERSKQFVQSLDSMFACTSPLTIGSDESSKNIVPQSTAKPATGLLPNKRDDPTLLSSRRLLPSVKDIAFRFNGQINRSLSDSLPPSPPSGRYNRMSSSSRNSSINDHTAGTNRSINSDESKDRIDEIRASITKLKYDGVGGIGKATSTLVRHQTTGRYVIADVDDEHFDDIMRQEIEVDAKSPLEEQYVVDDADSLLDSTLGSFIGDITSQNSSTGSVMSDDVVDDVVRAAIDAISSTSTDDVYNEPDDFFVVTKSGTNQWSSFQSPTNNEKYGSFVEKPFDINPLNDWDEWRYEKDSSEGADILKSSRTTGKATIFPSPTSVIMGRRYNAEVVAWNPFDI